MYPQPATTDSAEATSATPNSAQAPSTGTGQAGTGTGAGTGESSDTGDDETLSTGLTTTTTPDSPAGPTSSDAPSTGSRSSSSPGSNDGPTQPDGTTAHTPALDAAPPLFRDGVIRTSTDGVQTYQDGRGATTVNTDGSETSITDDGRAFTDQTDGTRTSVGPIAGGNDSHIVTTDTDTDTGTKTDDLDGSTDYTRGDGTPVLHENPDHSDDITRGANTDSKGSSSGSDEPAAAGTGKKG